MQSFELLSVSHAECIKSTGMCPAVFAIPRGMRIDGFTEYLPRKIASSSSGLRRWRHAIDHGAVRDAPENVPRGASLGCELGGIPEDIPVGDEDAPPRVIRIDP